LGLKFQNQFTTRTNIALFMCTYMLSVENTSIILKLCYSPLCLCAGVYADDNGVKEFLSEKYGKLSDSEFKENKKFNEDLIENDICVTVRLQIVYGRTSK
jgi:hypothetical protein